LYRVTCGDIPTSPDEVEKYLETVLLLGKTWGCGWSFPARKLHFEYLLTTFIVSVVLLDEADVFLEQRTLQDLQRNALVSGKGDGAMAVAEYLADLKQFSFVYWNTMTVQYMFSYLENSIG
jgi:hypothetical protein